jgi:hypothetical protein
MNILMKITGDIQKWAKDEQARIDKALVGSLYDATYALYQQAKSGLKAGTLGLPERKAFQNLRAARKETKIRQDKSAKIRGGKAAAIPLKPLAGGVIYKVFKSEKRSEVGFIGQEGGAGRIAQWAEELAGKHQPGYTLLYDKNLREKLHGMGIHLKKSTTSAQVPSRKIIGNVRTKYGLIALDKLADSFERKMAGERT